MPNGETAPQADGHNEHECPVSQTIPQMELEVVDQGDKAKTKSPRSKTPTLGDLATGNGNFSANPKIASLQRLYRKFLTVQQGAIAAAAPTVFQAGEELIALKSCSNLSDLSLAGSQPQVCGFTSVTRQRKTQHSNDLLIGI
jgi:hypothetical protein